MLDNHLALLQETKDTLNEMLQKRAGREKNTVTFFFFWLCSSHPNPSITVADTSSKIQDPTTPSPHDETVDDETECALATVREFEEEWAMPAPLSIVKGGEARGQQVDKGSGQVEESKGGSGKETVEES